MFALLIALRVIDLLSSSTAFIKYVNTAIVKLKPLMKKSFYAV